MSSICKRRELALRIMEVSNKKGSALVTYNKILLLLSTYDKETSKIVEVVKEVPRKVSKESIIKLSELRGKLLQSEIASILSINPSIVCRTLEDWRSQVQMQEVESTIPLNSSE